MPKLEVKATFDSEKDDRVVELSINGVEMTVTLFDPEYESCELKRDSMLQEQRESSIAGMLSDNLYGLLAGAAASINVTGCDPLAVLNDVDADDVWKLLN